MTSDEFSRVKASQSRKIKISLDKEALKAFHDVRTILTSAEVLAFPNPEETIILTITPLVAFSHKNQTKIMREGILIHWRDETENNVLPEIESSSSSATAHTGEQDSSGLIPRMELPLNVFRN